ncbi:ATP-binding protein [Fibrobacter sp. HC4]|uniref:ATP-binding protein n=1 Tax=Fibrobacter sp. HC4 TaxID=3239812 RepID=UPI0020185B59|nr:ATP-binding protein [Fibrobacter succinogenes]MCL4102000.1 hypothetical protein [Fibrobacter succinogenes]
MDKKFDDKSVLENISQLYLNKSSFKAVPVQKQEHQNWLRLFQIDEITFEEKAPRKEALENVLGALRIEGVNVVYILLGSKTGVKIYLGVAQDTSFPKVNIHDIGTNILEPAFKGNFRGSKIRALSNENGEQDCVVNKIFDMRRSAMLEGVPGVAQKNNDDGHFQGVDRLIDSMLGTEFCVLVLAKALSKDEIAKCEKDVFFLYNSQTIISKVSHQESTSRSDTEGTSASDGTNSGESHSIAKNFSESKNDSTTNGSSSGSSSSSKSSSTTHGTSESGGTTSTDGDSSGKNHSDTSSKSHTDGVGSAVTREIVNKHSQNFIKFLDEVQIPRLDYGSGKGIFVTSTFLFANTHLELNRLANIASSIWAGETGNKVSFDIVSLQGKRGSDGSDNSVNEKIIRDTILEFQLPKCMFSKNPCDEERYFRTALSQVEFDGKYYFGNWLTSKELAVIAGIPQKEVVGVNLREEVEFGLNYPETAKDDQIALGNLVISGSEQKQIPVYLKKDVLDKHVFVSGVTGSGKTTTCMQLLEAADCPFMVIEPAKREYRALLKKRRDVLVFTIGDVRKTPFRLNPFEFYPHESITSHVDMIKACIESSSDMEAAIPQIIERSIYECYRDYGWNIDTNENDLFKDPFAKGVRSFPTMEDVINKSKDVVKDFGFSERLEGEYRGSILAYMSGLVVGAKGVMLNVHRSMDFEQLLEKNVVLELEDIKSSNEKALLMGFIFCNINEAIKSRHAKNPCQKHITLIEEAHRLLTSVAPGENQSRKLAVDSFTDMLAEVRKYGESLIIVDQIPNKLTSEVLKNTNTKIVHRLFAQDDKDAIGNTMALSSEQKKFLSNLVAGRAILFSQDFPKAIQVQINQSVDTVAMNQISDADLLNPVYDFYVDHYLDGSLIPGNYWRQKPTRKELVEKVLFVANNLPYYKDMLNNVVSVTTSCNEAEVAIGKFRKKGVIDYDDIRLMNLCLNPNVDEDVTEKIVEFIKSDFGCNFGPKEINSIKNAIREVIVQTKS